MSRFPVRILPGTWFLLAVESHSVHLSLPVGDRSEVRALHDGPNLCFHVSRSASSCRLPSRCYAPPRSPPSGRRPARYAVRIGDSILFTLNLFIPHAFVIFILFVFHLLRLVQGKLYRYSPRLIENLPKAGINLGFSFFICRTFIIGGFY